MARGVLLTAGIALLAGLVAGITAGLFGIGGGVVMVPVLHYGLGLAFPLATAVSLFVIAFNTPFGLWRQHRHGNVLWVQGGLLALGGAAGVGLAILARPWLPVVALKALFALVMAFAALRMVRRTLPSAHKASRWWLVPAGVVAGFAANLLGIGGGLLMVPVLVFLGVGIHQAVATSLVAVFTNALVSTVGALPVLVHHLALAVPLAVGAVVGIRLGVHLANRLHAVRLRQVFALFLALMAAYVLWDALGGLRAVPPPF